MTGVTAVIPKVQFCSSLGIPMILGTVTVYLAGTTTPTNTWQDKAMGSANTNPIALDSRGECLLWLDPTKTYKFVLKNALGVTQWTVDDIAGAEQAGLRELLAASGGSALVGFIQAGTGAGLRTMQAKARDHVSVLDFYANGVSGAMVDPTGVADSTLGIAAAITQAKSAGKALHAPAGTYKITSTLIIDDEIEFYGDGRNKTIFNFVSAAVVPAISVACGSNASIIGLVLRGFQVICNGGAAVCDGLALTTTATNSAISQSAFEDIYILNPRKGVTRNGVIYMNRFNGITVSGVVTVAGWEDSGVLEVIYNRHENLEVTGVGNGAYAYNVNSASSEWDNITADGCVKIGGAYSKVRGLAVEGISAATPASTNCIELVQVQEISGTAIINVPNTKCSVGISANGNINILGLRFPDSGLGNQPNRPVLFDAATTGVMSAVQMDRTCVTKLTAADLAGVIAVGCASITDFGLVYKAPTSFTPAFATWSTAPTVIASYYVRIGNQITVSIYAQNGICIDYSTITGLPFTSHATYGAGTAGMSSGDVAKRFQGSIIPGATQITNIPAQTLTGVYWQLTATYLA